MTVDEFIDGYVERSNAMRNDAPILRTDKGCKVGDSYQSMSNNTMMKVKDYGWLLDVFPGSTIRRNGKGGILVRLPPNARCVQSVSIPPNVTLHAQGGIDIGAGVTVQLADRSCPSN